MTMTENSLKDVVQDALAIDDCISIMEEMDKIREIDASIISCYPTIHRVIRSSVERILVSMDHANM